MELYEEIKELKKKFDKGDSVLIPALHKVVEKYGYVSEEGARTIAEVLDISLDHVISVATFYQFFKLKPVGKYHFQICTGLTCMINGALDLVHYFNKELGVKENQVTGDGLFSYEIVQCIGCGDKAPAVLMNEKRLEGLKVDALKKMIDELRSKEGGEPS